MTGASKPKDNGTYQLITPPNTLKERVGAGVGIDASLVERADAAVEKIQHNFLQKVSMAIDDLAEQAALIGFAGSDIGDPGQEILEISQALQMQGAAFGYPMIGDVFGSLCGYIDNLKQPDDLDTVIVVAHIDALRSAAGNEVEDDGGSVGQELVASLNELVYKALR